MQCPLCQKPTFGNKNLDENLQARECSKCGGYWISSSRYHKWLETHGQALPEKPLTEVGLTVEDSQSAKLCPECGRIMIKYKVGHGVTFYLDRCAGCGGVWLDKNEWEVLKSRNLHDDLHCIFTTHWQQGVLAEETAKRLESIYAEKFGADYEEINRFKGWLEDRPAKSEILAFLSD